LPSAADQSLDSHIQTVVTISPNASEVTALNKLFEVYAWSQHGLSIPDDFLQLVIQAKDHLVQNHRRDVVSDLVQVIGTMRKDSSDSLLPVRRMPMGLLEYMLAYYAADTKNGVSSSLKVLMSFYVRPSNNFV
jgi:hypothetical protein